ncbi:MAG TPA: NAD(P)H-dependent oxidoreductase [Xanthobacteraceae bacterium]|jgi:putative NADPH-quinone reductase
MPGNVVVIQGHPDPAGGHLCHALADAYAEGATAAGHTVGRVEIARLDFPMLRTPDDFEKGALPESLIPARDAILAATHIVIVFPLWLGTMPAIVKAFLEQVMRPGVAFAYQKSGMPKKLLAGRSARIVVTMGMPALAYRWYFFAHGLRGLERNILGFVGIKPIRESLYGMVHTASDAKRKKWLARMHALGKELA